MEAYMEPGRFETTVEDDSVLKICRHILYEPINHVSRICERYGTSEEEVREYDVYSIACGSQNLILKKTDYREMSNYEKYLRHAEVNVPQYFGKYDDGSDIWIVLEKIEGEDLRNMTNQLAISAADTIAQVQNQFWGCTDSERFYAYWERINRRYQFIKSEPIIGSAYKIFLDRQQTCPRTMSNGDFLEFNLIAKDDKVFAVDWGFGGVMPYSLDIARFIAHGTEDRATFPFYMTDEHKKLFVQRVYDNLIQKPEYTQFIMDIELAVLNEYVEFIEANEDEDKWYFHHAQKLSREIIERTNSCSNA